MWKCYNIMVTGKVQDIGFRVLVEDIARLYDLRGFAFNDVDGSVKMVCCGENGIIDEFLEELKERGTLKGAVIDEIVKAEIPAQIYLPHRFMRLYTDELADINRKLDTGIALLNQIATNTSELPSIKKGIESLNTKFDGLNTKFESLNTKFDSFISNFDSFIGEQREQNRWMKAHLIEMKEHNQRLEKILEKLAEK